MAKDVEEKIQWRLSKKVKDGEKVLSVKYLKIDESAIDRDVQAGGVPDGVEIVNEADRARIVNSRRPPKVRRK